MEKIVISIAIGLLGLLTLWVKWMIDKRREREKYRREMIKKWRDAINSIDDSYFNNMGLPFGDMLWYSSLRLHMKTDIIDKLEKPRTFIVPSDGRQGFPKKQYLLDEIARIEKEWGLI